MEVSGVAIVFPVGHSVANHKALKVGDPAVGVCLLCIVDVSVDSQSKLRNIDSGIRFTRDVQGVVLESNKLVLEEIEEGNKVIVSGVSIVESALILVSANGIANTSGRFNIDHVGVVVP